MGAVAVGDLLGRAGHPLDRLDAEAHDPPRDRAEHGGDDDQPDDLDDDQLAHRVVDVVERQRGDQQGPVWSLEHADAVPQPVVVDGAGGEVLGVTGRLGRLLRIDVGQRHLAVAEVRRVDRHELAVGVDHALVDVGQAVAVRGVRRRTGGRRPVVALVLVDPTLGGGEPIVDLVDEVGACRGGHHDRGDREGDDDERHPGQHPGAQ